MPPPAHVKTIFSGTLGPLASPKEIWSFSVSSTEGDLAAASDSVRLTVLKAGADAAKTLMWSLQDDLTASVNVTRVRCVMVGSDGLYRRAASGQYLLGDNTETRASSSSTATGPFQVALAVTLDTDLKERVGRGRFYLPGPRILVDPLTGKMTAAEHTRIAGKIDTFLDSLQSGVTSPGWNGIVSVASGGSPSKGIAPAIRPVSQRRVGDVYDTIRSRRNALVETRIVQPD